jgi:surfactin synthase thioesterase subunit
MSFTARNRWFRAYQPRQLPRARLFAFHHAGGSASQFRTWPARLPSWIELVAIQLPAREDRLAEPPLRSVDDVTAALLPAMVPLLDLPAYLFGHSMGALLAYEVTRALRRFALPMPRHLLVSGRCAPHDHDRSRALSRLPDAELVTAVGELGGTPKGLLEHGELLALLVPTLRADFALCDGYRHRIEPALAVPLTAMGGVDDPVVDASRLEKWRLHTSSAFRVSTFPGDHFFVASSHEAVLAEIGAALIGDRAAGTPPGQSDRPSADRLDVE